MSDEKYIEGPKVLFKKGKYQALEFDYNNLHFILVCIQKFSLLHAVNDYTLFGRQLRERPPVQLF